MRFKLFEYMFNVMHPFAHLQIVKGQVSPHGGHASESLHLRGRRALTYADHRRFPLTLGERGNLAFIQGIFPH